MSMEDDLFNAFKYMGFNKGVKPDAMLTDLLKNMQLSVLTQFRAEIDKMIGTLSAQPTTSGTSIPDPFEILGIKSDATEEEVKKAYRKKAAKAHPDKGGLNEEMMMVNAAYEAIMRVRGWK